VLEGSCIGLVMGRRAVVSLALAVAVWMRRAEPSYPPRCDVNISIAQEKWCCSCLAAIGIPVSCVVLIACFRIELVSVYMILYGL